MTDSKPSAAKLHGANRPPQPLPILPAPITSQPPTSSPPPSHPETSQKHEAPTHPQDAIGPTTPTPTTITLTPTSQTSIPISLPLPPPSTPMSRTHLLLTSLGNPAPLHHTRHSAGHILLKSLSLHLHAPPFQRSKPHAAGHLTHSGQLTLWQSPTLMNVSGPAVLAAWRTFVKDMQKSSAAGGEGGEAALGLVVLHDELEAPPGTLKVRHGMKESVKGHNGLKSVMESLRGAGFQVEMSQVLVRVGVGIGRPLGGMRSRDDISDYVLGKCTVSEREGIERLVGTLEGVLGEEGERIASLRS